MRGWSADEDTYLQGQPFSIGFGLMNADAAMDLVMQADLLVLYIIVPGKLDTVHTQVGIHNAGLIDILRINLRHSDERAAVQGPVHYLRQVADLRLAKTYW